MNHVEVKVVGVVESSLTDVNLAPRQADEGAPEAWLVFNEEVREALRNIRRGDKLVVLTWLHRGQRDVLRDVAQLAGHHDRAAGRCQLTGDQPQQRRLAGSVEADQAGAAGPDRQRDAGERRGPIRPGEVQAGTGDDRGRR